MKISIAMATYNGAQYIQEQLQSFFDQTRQPDELIITDDCSTDETETIVREFAKTAPFRVDFYRNEENLGYCGNFNAALIKTTGDLVFLSDQDDVWFPNKIEHVVRVAERNPEALVIMNDAALTDSELNEVGLTKVGQIRSAGYKLDHFVMGCCCAVRVELLEIALPIPVGVLAHDNWLVGIADGLKAKVVDTRILQYYRRHESNESQFVANRIKKVTRISRLLHDGKKVFHPATRQIELQSIEQNVIFIDTMRSILLQAKAPRNRRLDLECLLLKAEKRKDLMEKRARIREQALMHRVFLVIKYAINLGYKGNGGIKALLRDLAG